MDAHRATRRRIVIGTAITAALLAAGTLIIFLEDIRRATAARYEVAVLFTSAAALRDGATVRVAGRPVGTVTAVDVLDRPTASPARIVATVELPAEARPYVRRGSRARLIQPGIAGDAIVVIEPGPSTSPPLDPGDTLVAVRPVGRDRLARQADDVLLAWDSLAASVAAIRGAARETGPELDRALAAVRAAAAELERSRERYRAGPLGEMLRDPRWPAAIGRMRRAAVAVRDGFDGDGAGGAANGAVEERAGDLGGAIARLLRRADSLRSRVARLEERMRLGGGLPSRLATDTALQAALRGVRAQLDSLIAEGRANPLRFVF